MVAEGCSVSWGYKHKANPKAEFEESEEMSLVDLSFKLNKGERLVGIGPIGAGKTTLLYSLMHETIIKKGKLDVKDKVAYVEQEPFIFTGSVVENVTFGSEFDRRRFNEVIRVCQMESDLKLLTKGENTIIGDKGVNISGGQKARLSLARAVYSNADIYLLDDPLSAVDPQVAEKLFKQCICNYLKDKSVVLVTH